MRLLTRQTSRLAVKLYGIGLAALCSLVISSCSQEAETYECGNWLPKITPDGREVIYVREYCEPPFWIFGFPSGGNCAGGELRAYDIQTRRASATQPIARADGWGPTTALLPADACELGDCLSRKRIARSTTG